MLVYVLLCFVSSITALPERERCLADLELQLEFPEIAFEEWVAEHNRVYVKGSDEWNRRYSTWLSNLHEVVDYNSKTSSHWLKMTGLADMSQLEVKTSLLGIPSEELRPRLKLASTPELADLSGIPTRVDWRAEGAVTSVKNQLNCSACWAFAAAGGVEGLYAIRTGELVPVSEQHLIDCDSYDNGCRGGLMETAFEWIAENGGVAVSEDYPFSAYWQTCDWKRNFERRMEIDGYETVEVGEEYLLKAIAAQPVSVAVEANEVTFALYGGGVFDAKCGVNVDHAALAVGYDLDEGFILVKNSWGESWGEDGYIKLALFRNGIFGQCGVARLASYPTIEAPEESTKASTEIGVKSLSRREKLAIKSAA